MYTLTKNQDSILKTIVRDYQNQEVTGGQFADELVDLLSEQTSAMDDEIDYQHILDTFMAIQAFREIDSEEDTDEEYTIYAEADGNDYDSEFQNYSFLRKISVPKGTRIGIEIANGDSFDLIIDQGISYG